MSGWILYATISGVIALVTLTAVVAGGFKLPKIDWRKTIAVVIVVGMLVSALPSILWWNSDRAEVIALQAELDAMAASYIAQYDEELEPLTGWELVDGVFLVFRNSTDGEGNKVVRVSAYIPASGILGTLWSEMGIIEDEPPPEEE